VKAFARLTVVVLVVVAIGIGVSASSWNQPTYGPSWGRFSIEFPSAPTTHIPRERDIWFASDVTHGVHESVDVRVFRADQYWSSAAEQEREIDQIVGQAATVTLGDGVTVIAPPPFCAGVCADVEFVREGPTVWAVEAAASKQAGPWVNPGLTQIGMQSPVHKTRASARWPEACWHHSNPRGKPCEASANPCATAGSWRLLGLRRVRA
jgi:hypothetical protein